MVGRGGLGSGRQGWGGYNTARLIRMANAQKIHAN